MGRSYNKGERVSNVRSLAQDKVEGASKTKEDTFSDEFGNKGMTASVADLEGFKAYVESLGLSKKQQEEILEKGLSSDEYLQLRVIKMLEDEKRGIIRNDAEDEKFKWSLKKVIEKWKHGETELVASYDRYGRFLGYNIGDERKVTANVPLGALVGGKTVHIHPTKEDQRLGMPFSRGDFRALRDYGMKEMIVTTREGVFTLKVKDGKSLAKLKDTDIKKTFAVLDVKKFVSEDTWNKTRGGARYAGTGRMKDELAVVQWRDQHETVKQVASRAGIEYTFKPYKGYEFLTDRKKNVESLP